MKRSKPKPEDLEAAREHARQTRRELGLPDLPPEEDEAPPKKRLKVKIHR